MHIQANSISLNSVNPYSAASDSAAASQRSADVRKRLLKGSSGNQAESDSELASFLDQWMDASPARDEAEDEYRRSDSIESDLT
jgi:hypothetical protein